MTQISDGRLLSINVDQQAVAVVREAVREICDGLQVDRSDTEREKWHHVICRLLSYLCVRRHLEHNTQTADFLLHYSSRAHSLPDISTAFLIKIINICDLHHFFLQVMSFF